LIDPVFPSAGQFNHVLAVVVAENKTYMMDMGDPQKPFHLIAFECLSNVGWALTEKEAIWININAEATQKQYAFQLNMNEQGILDGWAMFNASDYFGWEDRLEYREGKLPWKTMLETRLPGVTIDSVTVEGKETADANFKAKVHLHAEEALQPTDQGFLVPAILMAIFTKNPFEKEKRDLPVHLGFPLKERYNLSLKLPAGWKLDEVPAPIQIALPEQQGKIVFNAKQVDQTVNASFLLELKKVEFSPEEYQALRNLIIKYFECQQQMLVIKKA
jgi:hypothetical protein